MKRSALFITAALAGLVCGFLFRQGAAPDGPSSVATPGRNLAFAPGPGDNNSPLSEEKPQVIREWESRLAGYLNGPVPAAPAGADISPRAQADVVLRLLREPVSETSIREAVALFNTGGASRYAKVMSAVFERWAREAPEAALAAVRGLKVPAAKAALVWKVFEVSARNPGVMDNAMALPAGLMRSVALAALAESVPPGRESEALHEFIKDRQPGNWRMGGSFPYALFQKMIREDLQDSSPAGPGAPLRLALETEDPAWRAFLLKTALTLKESEAVANLEELARDPRNVPGLLAAIGGDRPWNQDPVKVKTLLALLPEDQRREGLVTQMGWWLTEAGLHAPRVDEGLETFLEEVQRTEGREGFRALVAKSALTQGARGLEQAARRLDSGPNSGDLEDLTRRATTAEPFTTARWLASMPPSTERDRAVAVFAATHAPVDPEHATRWAESISDAAKRAEALNAVRKNAVKP